MYMTAIAFAFELSNHRNRCNSGVVGEEISGDTQDGHRKVQKR